MRCWKPVGSRNCWQFTDEIIARVSAARPDEAPFDDIDEQFNWIYNHKAASLRALGRWDEALVVMEAARLQPEGGSINVSQAINLGWHYVDYGKPENALKALDGIDWAHSLSPYGRMQLQYVRYRAYLQLANVAGSGQRARVPAPASR